MPTFSTQDLKDHYDRTKHTRYNQMTTDLWQCAECIEIGNAIQESLMGDWG
jgi:hypothetical protein